jgi:expansin (peptidoglycan-binding protein)
VTCDITTPLILRNKEGTSQWWFSMQVINHNEPIASLQVSTDSGKTWQATTRRDYNFFENSSGFGTSTVDVKVTSSTGKTITVKGVSVAALVQTKAASNF